jgi:hypothetical protein
MQNNAFHAVQLLSKIFFALLAPGGLMRSARYKRVTRSDYRQEFNDTEQLSQ